MARHYTWGDVAWEVIAKNYSSIKDAQPDLDDEEVLKLVSRNHYPFGERDHWPYKAWLKALKDFRSILKKDSGLTDMNSRPLFAAITDTKGE